MLHILANSYTALIFLVTFLIKQKSNKLLKGAKQQQNNNKLVTKLHAA
jgi:hypothetical protein